jgi:hypothetical protein
VAWISDVEVAREITDDLVRGFATQPALVARYRDSDHTPIVYAWAAETHRLVGAALTLIDQGYGAQAATLGRSAIEFTVQAHWLSRHGREGLAQVVAEHKRNMTNLVETAKDGPIEIPPGFAETVAAIDVPVDQEKVFRYFQEVCKDLNLESSMYAAYRLHSGFAHPSYTSALTYLDENDEEPPTVSIRRVPHVPVFDKLPLMLAGLCVWSGRALDDLLVGKPRKQELVLAAKRLGAARTLDVRPVE